MNPFGLRAEQVKEAGVLGGVYLMSMRCLFCGWAPYQNGVAVRRQMAEHFDQKHGRTV